MKTKFIKIILIALLATVFLVQNNFSACSADLPQDFTTEAYWYDGKWAHEHSNIPPDPKISFGRLENGFRYVIVPHEEDKKRVSLYLNVQVGSLMEEKAQLGYAHIVEHMVFNGTENFPAGSLIPFFQENGMSFGTDTNAHTSLSETVYKLNLAENTEKSLQDGLSILRDFADKALFEEAEVEQEIDVILAEKNSSDSEAFRLLMKRNEILYAGTKFINSVIGTEETIKSASSEKLKAFYEKWYTPNRMVLVVVGQVDKNQIEEMIQASFNSMEKKELAQATAWGSPKGLGINPLPEVLNQGGASVSVIMHYPRVHERDSINLQREELFESIVNYAVNPRLQTLAEKESGLWVSANVSTNYKNYFTPVAILSASTEMEKWEKILQIFTDEIARIKKYGITQEEITEAIDDFRLNFTRYKQRYDQVSNSAIANNIIYSINKDRVYSSLDFDEKLLDALLKQMNVENVSKKAKDIYSSPNVSLIVSGKTPPSKEEIKAVWDNSQTKELAKYKYENIVNFPYLELPKPIAKDELSPLTQRNIAKVDDFDLVLWQTSLANGVDLYILPMHFYKKHVSVELMFGNGDGILNDQDLILSNFSEYVMAGSGLGGLSLGETRKLSKKLDGSTLESYNKIYNMISANGDAEQLESIIQAVWTQYMDPVPIQEGMDQVKFVMENLEERHKNIQRHWKV